MCHLQKFVHQKLKLIEKIEYIEINNGEQVTNYLWLTHISL